MSKFQTTILVLTVVGCSALMFWSFMTGFSREEIVECNKWQSQAQEYSGFYITHWQDEQCRAHGIGINAPVR